VEQLLVLASSKSGNAGEKIDAAVARLRKEAEVEVRTIDGADDLESALDARADRTLVVAGGDGALHFAANALRRRGELATTPIGLVPLGTGNDFARSLGGPMDPEGAAAALLGGTDENLDLLLCSRDSGEGDDPSSGETVVVNAAHFGVGARAGAAATRLKPYLGPLAYPLGSVAAGASTRGWQVTVEIDGRHLVEATRVLMVGFGNGRTAGGGTPLQPDADLDDGQLDVMISTATGALGRVSWALALRRGRHLERGDTVSARGKRVTVRGEALPGNIDGEIFEASTLWTLHVEANAWRVRLPVRSDSA
jgi:YegS/Rv2252/BmrU family lipid kinase